MEELFHVQQWALCNRRTDAAGFEAVRLGLGDGGEADAVLEGDAVYPVTVLEMKDTQYQISDERV